MVMHERIVTVDEFEAFLVKPENADRLFELIQGEIVEKSYTQLPAAVVSLIIGNLFVYFQENPIGWVLAHAGYHQPGDSYNLRLPSVSVVLDRSRPLVEAGAAPYIPDMAIEVQSPDDTLKKMQQKGEYYLDNGARMVWLVYPYKRMVEVLTPDDRHLLNEGELIEGGNVLPGFQLPVSQIFPALT